MRIGYSESLIEMANGYFSLFCFSLLLFLNISGYEASPSPSLFRENHRFRRQQHVSAPKSRQLFGVVSTAMNKMRQSAGNAMPFEHDDELKRGAQTCAEALARHDTVNPSNVPQNQQATGYLVMKADEESEDFEFHMRSNVKTITSTKSIGIGLERSVENEKYYVCVYFSPRDDDASSSDSD